MSVNITVANANMGAGGFGTEPNRAGRASQLVSLTGVATAAGDTSAAFTFRITPAFVEGGAYVLESISGKSASFKSLIALGSNTVYVRVWEALP